MKTPLIVNGVQRLDVDTATQAVKQVLSEHYFEISAMMCDALARAFGCSEEDVCLSVRDVFSRDDKVIQVVIDDWLMCHVITRRQYIRQIVNLKWPVDGLFPWLAVHGRQQHINIMHAAGIWTSHCSELVIMTDATIMLVLHCFLVTLPMAVAPTPKVENAAVDFISMFVDPKEVIDRYVTVPQVLNKPVLDVGVCLDELGLTEKEPQMSIQDHLACMLQITSAKFQAHLSTWITNYASDVHMIEKWLAVCGLTLQDYLLHLKGQGTSDGLELWLTSMGMDTPFNVVLEDVVWSTSHAGIDFQYPIFMLVSYTDFILCEEQLDDDLSQLGVVAP